MVTRGSEPGADQHYESSVPSSNNCWLGLHLENQRYFAEFSPNRLGPSDDIAVLYDYVQANAANEFREVTRKATRIERQTLECLSPWSI